MALPVLMAMQTSPTVNVLARIGTALGNRFRAVADPKARAFTNRSFEEMLWNYPKHIRGRNVVRNTSIFGGDMASLINRKAPYIDPYGRMIGHSYDEFSNMINPVGAGIANRRQREITRSRPTDYIPEPPVEIMGPRRPALSSSWGNTNARMWGGA